MLACIFAKGFSSQALFKGGLYFLGFLIVLYLIDRVIDLFGKIKSKNV
jgi:hypothetical protein